MRKLVTVAAAMLLVVALAPLASAAPADGNGNKFVVELDLFFPDDVDCGGGNLLDVHLGGWMQGKLFKGKGNRNVDLTVFHIVVTFTNDFGETFVYRDVGPDRWYFDKDGNLIVTITGRPGDAGELGFSLSGHMVINTDTGEAVWHGKGAPTDNAQACAALT